MSFASLTKLPAIETIPSQSQFLKLAKSANLIPVYHEVMADLETPVSALLKLGESDHTFLLESVEKGENQGRYSLLGNSALFTLSTRGTQAVLQRKGEEPQIFTAADPLQALEAVLSKFSLANNIPGLPRFFGGAVGYLGYEATGSFEPSLPQSAPSDLDVPDSYFLITDRVLVFDHVRRSLKIVVNAVVGDDPVGSYDKAKEEIAQCLAELAKASKPSGSLKVPSTDERLPAFTSTFSLPEFVKAVEKGKEHIAAGDIFQVVLSQRLSVPVTAPPLAVYRTLRSLNPSPYMFFLKFPEFALVGSSPEVMVRLEDGVATLRPIAGTRPRGANATKDGEMAKELLADEKERAEHVMLVDLGRNDLGRVCEYSSVVVDQFMTVEKYSHVMHIVSNIQGRLAADRNPQDLLRATFPAGTVSGAPKLRAMEIIKDLEPVARGPYAGCIGYLGFNGNVDSCITIRTVLIKDGLAHIQAGAGIVADSDPEREYEETLNKARAVLGAVYSAEVDRS